MTRGERLVPQLAPRGKCQRPIPERFVLQRVARVCICLTLDLQPGLILVNAGAFQATCMIFLIAILARSPRMVLLGLRMRYELLWRV